MDSIQEKNIYKPKNPKLIGHENQISIICLVFPIIDPRLVEHLLLFTNFDGAKTCSLIVDILGPNYRITKGTEVIDSGSKNEEQIPSSLVGGTGKEEGIKQEEEEAPSEPGSWACSTCTFVNGPIKLVCEACGIARIVNDDNLKFESEVEEKKGNPSGKKKNSQPVITKKVAQKEIVLGTKLSELEALFPNMEPEILLYFLVENNENVKKASEMILYETMEKGGDRDQNIQRENRGRISLSPNPWFQKKTTPMAIENTIPIAFTTPSPPSSPASPPQRTAQSPSGGTTNNNNNKRNQGPKTIIQISRTLPKKTSDLDTIHVDVHGLTVKDALALVQKLLTTNSSNSIKYLYVVTGQGKHSPGGEAKIRPALITFLQQSGYVFEEDQGSLLIHLKK